MKIYIASSWKNRHAVELLTEKLRTAGHEVLSFVENNNDEAKDGIGGVKEVPFEQWVMSAAGLRSFKYDTDGAMLSDLVIYISPSGQDAWAEVGSAFASGTMIFGLWAKGEQVGLMRRMIGAWYNNFPTLLEAVEVLRKIRE